MAVIRIKHVPDFLDADVVLLAMDGAGVEVLLAALTAAEHNGAGRLPRPGRVHEFVIEAGAADIELAEDRVVWRLDRAVTLDIIEKLTGLAASGRPCHTYVDDLVSPAPELVLSRDEYIQPSWLTAGKEPIFGDDHPD